MKLSQLAAESAARLKDLRDMEGPTADADCICFPLVGDEFEVAELRLFQSATDGKMCLAINEFPDAV